MKAIITNEFEATNQFVVDQTNIIIKAILELSEQDRLFLAKKIEKKPNLLKDKMPLIKTFI